MRAAARMLLSEAVKPLCQRYTLPGSRFILQVVIPVRLKSDLSSLLWHWTSLYVPDVGCVLGDGAVAGEFSRARYIQDGFPSPLVRVGVQRAQPLVSVKVRPQVRKVHIVIAVR